MKMRIYQSGNMILERKRQLVRPTAIIISLNRKITSFTTAWLDPEANSP